MLNTNCQECRKRGAREALGLPLSFKSIEDPARTFSVVQLKGKHCRKPNCHNGVVDTFGRSQVLKIWSTSTWHPTNKLTNVGEKGYKKSWKNLTCFMNDPLSRGWIGAGIMLSTRPEGKKMWPYLVLHCSCRSPSLETDAFLFLLSSNMSVHTIHV